MELSSDDLAKIYLQLGVIDELTGEHDSMYFQHNLQGARHAAIEIEAVLNHELHFNEIRNQAFELFGDD